MIYHLFSNSPELHVPLKTFIRCKELFSIQILSHVFCIRIASKLNKLIYFASPLFGPLVVLSTVPRWRCWPILVLLYLVVRKKPLHVSLDQFYLRPDQYLSDCKMMTKLVPFQMLSDRNLWFKFWMVVVLYIFAKKMCTYIWKGLMLSVWSNAFRHIFE